MTQGHLSTADVGEMAAPSGVKTVILAHLTYKPDDDYAACVAEVKNHFSGHVLVGKDLKEF